MSSFNWPDRPDWVDSARTEDGSFNNKLVIVEVRYHDVTFEDLQRLSITFGTTLINVGSEIRESGGCETCNFTYTVSVITIMNPTRMP